MICTAFTQPRGPRYEREFKRGHRPVLRKVLERDEPASRAVVLAIAATRAAPAVPPAAGGACEAGGAAGPRGAAAAGGVHAAAGRGDGGAAALQVELTDGWYSVWAAVDGPLTHLVSTGRLHIGRLAIGCSGYAMAAVVNVTAPTGLESRGS